MVRLGVASITLQVYTFADAFLPEDMMTFSYPLDESQAQEELPEVVETDIGV